MATKTIAKKDNKKAEKESSSFAVIKTGGKQYLVREGREVLVEKLEGEEKSKIEFKEVLILFDGKSVKLGKPLVAQAKVDAKIISQVKADKVTVFKMKAKKRYRKTQGHRQKMTKVLIEKI